jgi:hypothetical protein
MVNKKIDQIFYLGGASSLDSMYRSHDLREWGFLNNSSSNGRSERWKIIKFRFTLSHKPPFDTNNCVNFYLKYKTMLESGNVTFGRYYI